MSIRQERKKKKTQTSSDVGKDNLIVPESTEINTAVFFKFSKRAVVNQKSHTPGCPSSQISLHKCAGSSSVHSQLIFH